MEFLDNTGTQRLGDALKSALDDGSRLSVIASYFTVFAYFLDRGTVPLSNFRVKNGTWGQAPCLTKTYRSVNTAMVKAYWEIGKHIVESQGGSERTEYGTSLISELSVKLTEKFGRGFTATNLRYMRQFYLLFPIHHTLCDELTWSHYRALLRVEDEDARLWYEREAANQGWSVRTLDRNISTQYYHRLLSSGGDGLPSGEGPVDLKSGQLTHQDIGQMDMYVRMYDELRKDPTDNPTLGIVLCTETDKDVAHFSVLNDSEQLFAAKYLTYLPTKEQLKREIDIQKEFFAEQRKTKRLAEKGV